MALPTQTPSSNLGNHKAFAMSEGLQGCLSGSNLVCYSHFRPWICSPICSARAPDSFRSDPGRMFKSLLHSCLNRLPGRNLPLKIEQPQPASSLTLGHSVLRIVFHFRAGVCDRRKPSQWETDQVPTGARRSITTWSISSARQISQSLPTIARVSE